MARGKNLVEVGHGVADAKGVAPFAGPGELVDAAIMAPVIETQADPIDIGVARLIGAAKIIRLCQLPSLLVSSNRKSGWLVARA